MTDPGPYKQLLDAAPDGMIMVGLDGRITFANAQMEQLFGYTREEIVGKTLDTLIPERYRAQHGVHVTRFFASPVRRPMGSGIELFGRRKDGSEIAIEVSISPMALETGPSACAAIRDITERKRAQHAARLADELLAVELRSARASAEAASAAKSEFLSSMSHELRTPLNAILGFAQLLGRDRREPLSERHRERAGQILKGGEHLLRLIDDILDLSRIEAGRISISTEPVDVRDVLEEVRRGLEPAASQANVRFDLAPAAEALPRARADRTRLAQIVMNLGTNAIKYNRPGGSVTVSARLADSRTLRVVVSDTGIGVPLDKQDKLFQPFQRAGQETGSIEGTGIGLTISRRLAELMGGRVGFRSTPGEGSEFWVELPAEAAASVKPQPAPAAEGRGMRLASQRDLLVLYVEDNPANVAFMQDALGEFERLELVTAPTAERGIELAFGRPPHAILMDINLPGLDGFYALSRLRAEPRTASVPVIALTALASERDRERGLRAGFYRYLTKPVQVEELVEALAAVLEK